MIRLQRRPALFLTLAPLLLLLTAAPPLIAQEPQLVDVYVVERDDGSFDVYANNNHIVSVYVSVDTPNLINLTADRSLPVAFGLEPGDREVPVFTLTPTRSTGRRGYSLQYSFAQGNPETAFHDEGHLYLLPFRHGAKHRLSQGFHGRFSHTGENEYSVDYEMEIGTEIFAARGGIVAELKEDSTVGGLSASYGDDANYILILHDDGTFGNYAHLVANGVIVKRGDLVIAGQMLGYSGNTGRTSGPHLHFDVRLPTYEGTMQSVPFLSRGRDGRSVSPEEGRFYYAYHPNGPEFDEIYGREITLESYNEYREPVDGPESLETRVEQIDLTFLLFVRNGFSEGVEVEIRLELSGLESDGGDRVTLIAPGRSEVLATILRPVPGAASIGYAYTISYVR